MYVPTPPSLLSDCPPLVIHGNQRDESDIAPEKHPRFLIISRSCSERRQDAVGASPGQVHGVPAAGVGAMGVVRYLSGQTVEPTVWVKRPAN